jgi:hypothetical protein
MQRYPYLPRIRLLDVVLLLLLTGENVGTRSHCNYTEGFATSDNNQRQKEAKNLHSTELPVTLPEWRRQSLYFMWDDDGERIG